MKPLICLRFLNAILICIAALCGKALFAGELEFTAGGDIVSPSGKISIGNGGGIYITTAAGDIYSLTIPTIVRDGRTHWTAGDLADRKIVVDNEAKETSFTANIIDTALASPIPVRLSIAVTSEEKARITLRYESKESIAKFLSLSGIFFYIQREVVIGSQITVDKNTTLIADGHPSSKVASLSNANKPSDVVFFSNDPYRSLSIHVVKAQNVDVRDENVIDWQTLGIRLQPVDNQIIFDVDLPKKAQPQSHETYANVDFYAAEEIHLPQYGLSRNLVQNPSFEQGFQYWNFGNLGSDKGNRYPDNYVVDAANCHGGFKCVKILGEKDESPALLSSFAIPVEAGKDYTLSFYAKGDQSNVQLMTSIFPSASSNGPSWKGFSITQEWQRYSYTFKAPSGALAVEFGISNPSNDCVGLLDDIQLEQGSLSDFTRKSLELAFATDHRDNLFKPDDVIHGRWEISGTPEALGTIMVTLRNIEGAVISIHQTPFKIGGNGIAVVNQPWLEHQARGLYTLEANINLTDGLKFREYGRLSIAPPTDPTVKHHTLFASGGVLQTRQGSWTRKLKLLEYFGIGSEINFDPVPHAHLALMKAHHITNVSSIFDSGDHFGEISLVAGWRGNEGDLAVIENTAYTKANAYPEIIYWKLVNEPRGNLITDTAGMKQWVVALTAAYRGIKRANPAAKVMSIDPANMSPTYGIVMLDKYLAAGGGAITDIIAIHPYRQRPESPDMDADITTLLDILKRHDYTGEIWFTEGGGHLGIHNPYFGLNVHKALSAEDNGGSWRIGNFTYDIGEGERYAAAYAVRAWLIGLKYGDRVKQQVDWYFGSGTIDYDGTAEVRAVALNTLKGLLGDADFVRDIPLNSDTRCYLFNDAQQRPIAAIWKINSKQKSPTTLHLGTLVSKLHIVNLVGSTIKADKRNDILVSAFPTYLRGEVGSAISLIDAIEIGFKLPIHMRTAK